MKKSERNRRQPFIVMIHPSISSSYILHPLVDDTLSCQSIQETEDQETHTCLYFLLESHSRCIFLSFSSTGVTRVKTTLKRSEFFPSSSSFHLFLLMMFRGCVFRGKTWSGSSFSNRFILIFFPLKRLPDVTWYRKRYSSSMRIMEHLLFSSESLLRYRHV